MKTMVSDMTRVCLGDVAHEVKQKAPVGQGLPTVGLEHLDSGGVELTRWDESAETTFTKAFSKGQVLFGRRRAYLRKAAVAPFDGICSGDITVIAAKSSLSPRLLPFIIQNDALFEHAVTNSAGSLSPRVKWQSLSQFEFELPGIDKQEELADTLWAAQETRSHYGQLIATCDDIVKSKFVEMFGDPGSSSKSFETQRVKEAVAAISDGPFGSNLKSSHYVHHGIRVLRLGNIKSGHFDNSDEAYITEEHYKTLRRYTCHPGDVLVGTLGEPNLRACIIPEYIPVSINKSDCVHISLNPNKLTAQYVCTYFNLRSTLLLAMKNMHGNTRSRITMSQVANLPMPVPPLELQQEFADFATSVDKSKFK